MARRPGHQRGTNRPGPHSAANPAVPARTKLGGTGDGTRAAVWQYSRRHRTRAGRAGGLRYDVTVHEPLPVLIPPRQRVRDAVAAAWDRAVASGALPAAAADGVDLPPVEIERPAKPEHGDLATSLPMKLARPYRMAPPRIAEAIAAELATETGTAGSLLASVEVAPPGFLNLRLADGALEELVAGILANPSAWGRTRAEHPRHVNVEFVSANPTGPLHIGNARGAFVGDLLCRVLEAAGHEVTREYYFNDFGAQVRNLGASVVAIRRGDRDPGGRLSGRLRRRAGRRDARRGVERGGGRGASAPTPPWSSGSGPQSASGPGIEASPGHPRRPLRRLEERELALREGWVDRAVERLRASGHVYEQDGALWFRSTDFGDDKDRVDPQVERRLRPTSRSDIGYVVEKFSRGFDHLDLHLGRRPPRDGGPAPQRRRGDGLRPRGRPDAPHGLGPLRPRRGRGLHVEAGRRVHHPRRAARARSAWTRPAGSSPPEATRSASTSTSSWPRSSRTRTRSTTSSTRTRGSPRSCARAPRRDCCRRPA